MKELDKLKNLLLKNEQEELKNLKERIDEITKISDNPEVIVKHISPLLSSIIKKSSLEDEKVLLDSLSPLVFELIDQNFVQSKDKITKQLAPLITEAIKEQIRSQKDEVVDALYPVLGNMISKYVSKTFEEMMNSINSQITNGLSFSVISRKIKAKVKGVSETELLLSENAIANIRSVFLIHKESGIVLSHAEHENNPINEPEMIASMMTAIRGFVNDWVEKNEKNHEIGTIEYGGSKIIIEPSGYSYLAVIVDGLVSSKTNERIRNVMEELVLSHSDKMKNFNGDLSDIPEESLNETISTLIDKTVIDKKPKKLHPMIYLIPILLLSWIGWIFYNNFIDNSILEKSKNLLYKNPKLTMYRIEPKVDDRILTLKGVVPSNELKNLSSNVTQDIKNLEEIKNDLVVIEQKEKTIIEKEKVIVKEKKISFLQDKVEFLITALNSSKNLNISYDLNDKNELLLKGEVNSTKEKEYLLKQFKNLKELTLVEDKFTIYTPLIDTIIYFDFNSTKIRYSQVDKLKSLISTLSKLDSNLILNIIVSNDNIGTNKINTLLNLKRAENVKNYLIKVGKISQEITILEKDENTKNILENKDVKHERYIIFSLENRS